MSAPRRFAAVADIHGNLPALEAVMADIRRRGIGTVVNLGDHVSGPLWPRETIELLMRQPWIQIAGNCDRQVVRNAPAGHGPSDRFAYERLTTEQRAWVAALPATAPVFDDVLLFHGTPSDDDAYLLETVEQRRVRLARLEEIAERLGAVRAPVMLCGHTHFARVVRAGDSLVVNPGSVGLPAYEHDKPEPHVMESGSPDARYAILERSNGRWSAELLAVPYEHGPAAARAERHGRQDWAVALRTGYMSLS